MLGGPGGLEHEIIYCGNVSLPDLVFTRPESPFQKGDAKKQLLIVHETLAGSLRMGPAQRTRGAAGHEAPPQDRGGAGAEPATLLKDRLLEQIDTS